MRQLITESSVLKAVRAGTREIALENDSLVTPAARDAARQHGLTFTSADQQPEQAAAQPARQTSGSHVTIGSDHGGYALKSALTDVLHELGYQVEDIGCYSPDPVDYPDIAAAVAERVSGGESGFGVIIDGAGIGSAIAANKFPGVRAACCNDLYAASNSREHNGANVLTLGGQVIGAGLARKILTTWLGTGFGGGRHGKRLNKIDALDRKYRAAQ